LRCLLTVVVASAFLASGALPVAQGAVGPPSAAGFAQAQEPRPVGPVGKPSLDDVQPRWVEGQVLVQWTRGVSRAQARSLHAQRGARVLSRIQDFGGIDVVALPRGMEVRRAVREYRRDPRVAIAEPNLLRSLLNHVPPTPDDTDFAQLWGLHNTGQNHVIGDPGGGIVQAAGLPDRDIDAPEAWQQPHTGEPIIAVVDTGARTSHEDLVGQLWEDPANPGVFGRNFSGGSVSFNVNDIIGHGTHVAGTIGAAANNAKGIAGVCPQCKIMVLKFDLTLANELRAFAFARNNGASIVNGSFGGGPWSQLERNAIRQMGNAGILAVFAAGNSSLDNDMFLTTRDSFSPAFPASYNLPNILSVAASNHEDRYGYETRCAMNLARWRCAFTNFGHDSVDVAAPGVDVYSTMNTSDTAYEAFNGTSMAAPHAAGVAGLVKSAFPGLSPLQMKNKIMRGTDRPPSLRTMYSRLFRGPNATGRFTRTSGRVNAEKALAAAPGGNATPRTDGNIDGATRANATNRGRVAYPHDINDVFKRRLVKGRRYQATLVVPRGKDYDLWIYKPGTTEIHQFELGCFGGPGRCKILDFSTRGTGRNEVIRFRAPQTGVHYFQVQAWLKHFGPYTFRLRRI
jgi:hypothetical protein